VRNLKALRVKFDLNQEDLAKILEISVVAYRNKENGKTQFTLEEAKKISNIFDFSIDEIFFEDKVHEKEIQCKILR